MAHPAHGNPSLKPCCLPPAQLSPSHGDFRNAQSVLSALRAFPRPFRPFLVPTLARRCGSALTTQTCVFILRFSRWRRCQVRDALYLDLSLDGLCRTAVERAESAKSLPIVAQLKLCGLVLENLCLSTAGANDQLARARHAATPTCAARTRPTPHAPLRTPHPHTSHPHPRHPHMRHSTRAAPTRETPPFANASPAVRSAQRAPFPCRAAPRRLAAASIACRADDGYGTVAPAAQPSGALARLRASADWASG